MRLDEIVKPILFLDLDGVMADFDAKVLEITGQMASNMDQKYMWMKISDVMIDKDGYRYKLLKHLSHSPGSTLTNLGFHKGQGVKQFNTLIRQGFVRVEKAKGGESTHFLTDKGQDVLKTVASSGIYKSGPDFYNSLDKMPDADQLWNAVKYLDPVIVTGRPMGKWAEPQKRQWVAREIGPNIPVIVCLAREKGEKAAEYLGTPGQLNGAILIDDRVTARPQWIAMGGRYILHTSASNSISQLKALLDE